LSRGYRRVPGSSDPLRGSRIYDECFGNGRIDALRAVTHDTSGAYDATAPFCPEYEE
jgi:hypothetical protein